MRLYIIQRLGRSYDYYEDLGVSTEPNAQIEIVRLDIGAGRVYNGANASLIGKGSSLNLKGAFYLPEGALKDTNYIAQHIGEQTFSKMEVSGLLDRDSEKSFRGTLDFKKGSKGSMGSENEDIIFLDEIKSNKSVPLILCGEEDVDGVHGASIGQISQEVLFYLNARGLTEQEARTLVTKSKLKKLSDAIPDEAIREKIGEMVEEMF